MAAALALVPHVGAGVLHLAPLLLLLGLLFAGRYVGEHQLERLRGLLARRRGPARRRPTAGRAPRPRPGRAVPRGGLLIGSSLAVRPPPSPVR
nr:hypothetical protein [Conexibacter arvalis]